MRDYFLFRTANQSLLDKFSSNSNIWLAGFYIASIFLQMSLKIVNHKTNYYFGSIVMKSFSDIILMGWRKIPLFL